ncbi:two-component system, OmpR family, aerobic respiration control sensor histidine kinase ArcB [Pseudoalteromonas sp. BSi20652]|uniref:response regulator n=1 Tax=Pseudoalteromonas sp. BSi20652 TaxID=388384 RepID=UPI0002319BEC|nr:response regulator [Pseudoalteromonas sp. BSi20652]GAA60694.1 two-component system, OmpR family, aerobic respiration control sensor histidine kinase ArcB [Pseudoalteromonas sp. BSi20652]
MFNVIGNAFKFTKHGQIIFKINLVDKLLTFAVEDSGIGIAQKHIDMIFEPFSQVNDSINRKSEGVGLGLSISKNLVELMGGQITVNTQIGLGSTFTISIPYEEAQQSEVLGKVIHKETYLSILVAEDNKTNQVLIKAYLEKLNHKVTLANHGREVIDLFQRKKFDLVLMDIMMPVMDGLTAAEYIRDELLSDVPIYALTANVEQENKASCFKAGMNKVLTKPIKLEALQAALDGVYQR